MHNALVNVYLLLHQAGTTIDITDLCANACLVSLQLHQTHVSNPIQRSKRTTHGIMFPWCFSIPQEGSGSDLSPPIHPLVRFLSSPRTSTRIEGSSVKRGWRSSRLVLRRTAHGRTATTISMMFHTSLLSS
jgi:hypothetical protein